VISASSLVTRSFFAISSSVGRTHELFLERGDRPLDLAAAMSSSPTARR
jgi:hypothetical protein